jgi:hypothetical protein
VPNVDRHLGRFEDAEASAGTRADEGDSSAAPERCRHHFDAHGDALALAA